MTTDHKAHQGNNCRNCEQGGNSDFCADGGNAEPYACDMCDRYERTIATLKAESHELAERLEGLLLATAPGLTTLLDHERDEARALLSRTTADCSRHSTGHVRAAAEEAMHTLLHIDADMTEREEAAKAVAEALALPWPPYPVGRCFEPDDGGVSP